MHEGRSHSYALYFTPHVRNFSWNESFLFFWRVKSTDSHESVQITWLYENIFAPNEIIKNMKAQTNASLWLCCEHEIISVQMLKIWMRRKEVCASLPQSFVYDHSRFVYWWRTKHLMNEKLHNCNKLLLIRWKINNSNQLEAKKVDGENVLFYRWCHRKLSIKVN